MFIRFARPVVHLWASVPGAVCQAGLRNVGLRKGCSREVPGRSRWILGAQGSTKLQNGGLRASDEARTNQASKITTKRSSITETSWLVSVQSLIGVTGESRMLPGFRETPEFQNAGLRDLDGAL